MLFLVNYRRFCRFLSVGASKNEVFDFFMRKFGFLRWFCVKTHVTTDSLWAETPHRAPKCCFWSIIGIFGHFLSTGGSETENFKFFLQNMKSSGDYVSENMLQNNFLGESFFPYLGLPQKIPPHLILVLVLVLIKDDLFINRMLTQNASVYPGFFLMPAFTSWHRKTHAVLASSLTSTQVWS